MVRRRVSVLRRVSLRPSPITSVATITSVVQSMPMADFWKVALWSENSARACSPGAARGEVVVDHQSPVAVSRRKR